MYVFKNVQTDNCLKDYGGPTRGLLAILCDPGWAQEWLFYLDDYDQFHHPIGTLQNVMTGQCLDDSWAGLRAYQCHPFGDDHRKFQQFKISDHRPPDVVVLQNMATGSCVDDSPSGRLRGYFCNGTYYQDWHQMLVP